MINKSNLTIHMQRMVLFICLIWFCSGTCFAASLPAALIQVPKNGNAIIVEKKKQMLYVYSEKEGLSSPAFQSPCSTGARPGPKAQAGDKKTPEGVYFLKDEFEDRYLTPVYGVKAFPSDYPNYLDRRLGRKGSAIWIHGTDRVLKPMDSNGCVALENNNIIVLSDYIHLDVTPLIIVEQIDSASVDAQKKTRKKINSLLEQWVKALTHQSYHDYLSFYDATYLPDIAWWQSWLKLRDKAFAKKSDAMKVILENTGIYAQGGVIVVITDMSLSKKGGKKIYLGKRQLFIGQSGGAPRIIGDLFQVKSKAFDSGERPLLAAARTLFQAPSTDKLVVKTVQQWMAAWSAKKMDKYAQFYTSDFICDGMGKSAWVSRKKNLAQKYDYIRVSGKNFKARPVEDGYVVSFVQDYRSSGFSAQGEKTLKLVKRDGKWKIFRENWNGK